MRFGFHDATCGGVDMIKKTRKLSMRVNQHGAVPHEFSLWTFLVALLVCVTWHTHLLVEVRAGRGAVVNGWWAEACSHIGQRGVESAHRSAPVLAASTLCHPSRPVCVHRSSTYLPAL